MLQTVPPSHLCCFDVAIHSKPINGASCYLQRLAHLVRRDGLESVVSTRAPWRSLFLGPSAACLESHIDPLIRWIPSITAPLSTVPTCWRESERSAVALVSRREAVVRQWAQGTGGPGGTVGCAVPLWSAAGMHFLLYVSPSLSKQPLSLLRLITPRTLQLVLPHSSSSSPTPVPPVSTVTAEGNSLSLRPLRHVRRTGARGILSCHSPSLCSLLHAAQHEQTSCLN